MAALTAGSPAPEFKLRTMDGKEFSLAEARRRGPVVLAFFKISCPVCQYAMPFLERLYQAYKGKPVTVTAVSQNSREETALFLKEYQITMPVALDDPASYHASNAYGLTNVPTVFCVSADGRIEVSSVGWSRADLAEINGKLADSVHSSAVTLFRPGEDVPELRAG